MSEKLKLTPAQKIAIVGELLGGIDKCPTCGHEAEKPALISIEDARKFLGFKSEDENDFRV